MATFYHVPLILSSFVSHMSAVESQTSPFPCSGENFMYIVTQAQIMLQPLRIFFYYSATLVQQYLKEKYSWLSKSKAVARSSRPTFSAFFFF